jgi:hypothetical protein
LSLRSTKPSPGVVLTARQKRVRLRTRERQGLCPLAWSSCAPKLIGRFNVAAPMNRLPVFVVPVSGGRFPEARKDASAALAGTIMAPDTCHEAEHIRHV